MEKEVGNFFDPKFDFAGAISNTAPITSGKKNKVNLKFESMDKNIND
jgi:hypothetical protein